MLLKICSVVSLDIEIHGHRLHYLDTGYCCSAELFVLWLHSCDGKDFGNYLTLQILTDLLRKRN